jgi:hypothetical protein
MYAAGCPFYNRLRNHLDAGLLDCIFAYQKILILVNFRRPWNGNFWYISWSFGILYVSFVYFVGIWYIL